VNPFWQEPRPQRFGAAAPPGSSDSLIDGRSSERNRGLRPIQHRAGRDRNRGGSRGTRTARREDCAGAFSRRRSERWSAAPAARPPQATRGRRSGAPPASSQLSPCGTGRIRAGRPPRQVNAAGERPSPPGKGPAFRRLREPPGRRRRSQAASRAPRPIPTEDRQLRETLIHRPTPPAIPPAAKNQRRAPPSAAVGPKGAGARPAAAARSRPRRPGPGRGRRGRPAVNSGGEGEEGRQGRRREARRQEAEAPGDKDDGRQAPKRAGAAGRRTSPPTRSDGPRSGMPGDPSGGSRREEAEPPAVGRRRVHLVARPGRSHSRRGERATPAGEHLAGLVQPLEALVVVAGHDQQGLPLSIARARQGLRGPGPPEVLGDVVDPAAARMAVRHGREREGEQREPSATLDLWNPSSGCSQGSSHGPQVSGAGQCYAISHVEIRQEKSGRSGPPNVP
jgi:hypothetical protein